MPQSPNQQNALELAIDSALDSLPDQVPAVRFVARTDGLELRGTRLGYRRLGLRLVSASLLPSTQQLEEPGQLDLRTDEPLVAGPEPVRFYLEPELPTSHELTARQALLFARLFGLAVLAGLLYLLGAGVVATFHQLFS